jgi:hypothetical protein
MTVIPLARIDATSAAAKRRVTILGATGSVGTSTIDLLRRQPERYRVEAVCARGNAAALAKVARDVNARFAAIVDVAAYRDLKAALAGRGGEQGVLRIGGPVIHAVGCSGRSNGFARRFRTQCRLSGAGRWTKSGCTTGNPHSIRGLGPARPSGA